MLSSKSYSLTNKESYLMKHDNSYNKEKFVSQKFGSNNYTHYKIMSSYKSSKNLTLIVYYKKELEK